MNKYDESVDEEEKFEREVSDASLCVVQEESKDNAESKTKVDLGKSGEISRLEKNVEAFDKKLSDFERMFLYINDELDFKQLSQMAEEVVQFKKYSKPTS